MPNPVQLFHKMLSVEWQTALKPISPLLTSIAVGFPHPVDYPCLKQIYLSTGVVWNKEEKEVTFYTSIESPVLPAIPEGSQFYLDLRAAATPFLVEPLFAGLLWGFLPTDIQAAGDSTRRTLTYWGFEGTTNRAVLEHKLRAHLHCSAAALHLALPAMETAGGKSLPQAESLNAIQRQFEANKLLVEKYIAEMIRQGIEANFLETPDEEDTPLFPARPN